VLLCERALWPGEANALPPVGRELIGGMDGMGDAWYYYYHALSVWRREVVFCFVGGDEQVGGASTDNGSPRACNKKSRMGRESRLSTVRYSTLLSGIGTGIGESGCASIMRMARRAGKGLQHHLNNSHAQVLF
jgi:hypothetical protein